MKDMQSEAMYMKFLPDFFQDTFDELFYDPFFSKSSSYMKTDIKEQDGHYLLDMELPGFKKEDIQLELKNGYLSIHAKRDTNNEEKDKEGNIIRQERFSGSCSRNFYVGEGVKQSDIKANFDNGELKILIPKIDHKEVEEKKVIAIE